MNQQQKNDYMKMGLCDNATNNKININKIYKMGNNNDYVKWGSNKSNGNSLHANITKERKATLGRNICIITNTSCITSKIFVWE
mmetsp:Transcript_8737/g.10871  ORF Transcript_8737/g.10871 Transcript_8737/m.10871 type:complete len:84 (+) Transcript_8737:74-325(+)